MLADDHASRPLCLGTRAAASANLFVVPGGKARDSREVPATV
jgi:hypothetical protein